MSMTTASTFFCPIRGLDLSSIEAVGFDLDHTLALYDDHAVNLLAAGETVPFLEDVGHQNATYPTENVTMTARGLSMDLRHGNTVKIGADGRVILARRGDTWLSSDEVAAIYDGHDPADEATTWHVNSPFDIPTLWFFSTLGPRIRDPKDTAYASRVLTDIRRSLDRSHTRGALKQHIMRDMARYISAPPGVRAGLERWKRAGKRLFVLTNSDSVYAARVLDHTLGSGWQDLFDMVLTDAGKPRFFADQGAQHVEQQLGVRASGVLYAGDNARTDIAPARRHGWKTLHVVTEIASAEADAPWFAALHHHGAPTWFARRIHDHADATCARIDAFLGLEPNVLLTPTDDFYARIATGDVP